MNNCHRHIILEKVCPEIEEIQNGEINYGIGYNGTILDGTVATFSCNSGTNITDIWYILKICNLIDIWLLLLGFTLTGPTEKICVKDSGFQPEEAIVCVKSKS